MARTKGATTKDRKSGKREAPVRAATASDILGFKPKAQGPQASGIEIQKKWIRHYKNLHELRRQIRSQMGQLAQDAMEEQPVHSLHMADSGTDAFDRDFALSLLSSEQNALYEIEEALRRIELGTFGVCEETGKKIPEERLAAVPWARYTIEAQHRLERENGGRRTQLGQLGAVPRASGASESDEEEESEEGQSGQS